MNDKMPYTPLSTHLSGSARETELRLRNIFSGPKKRPPALFLVLMFSVCVFCGNLVSCQSAGVESPLPTEVWVDYYDSMAMPWESSAEIEPPEYPGVTFHWTPSVVSAVKDRETVDLFGGMPVWNVFLCDLNGDGFREFCATASFGSGMIDNHIVVYDYAAGTEHALWDRGMEDYTLFLEDGQLRVTRAEYNGPVISVGGLVLTEDGTLKMTDEVLVVTENQDTSALTPGLTFTAVETESGGFTVSIKGSVGAFRVPSGTTWGSDPVYDVDLLGQILVPYPPFSEENGMIAAWWADESRTAVTVTGQPLAMTTSGADYTGWRTFTVSLDGNRGSITESHTHSSDESDENIYLASLSDEEAVVLARFAAKLLTGVEDYYQRYTG